MLNWRKFAEFSDDALHRLDIAAVNLACAADLPGGPTEAEAGECVDRLDHYARCTEHYTRKRLPEFYDHAKTFDDSEAIFRVVCMARLLQLQFGVRYNPAKKADDAPFGTGDIFIHGTLLGQGGTCGTLPVVYAAVGRRLGYPIKLVRTWSHMFCRWDGDGFERFNIEVNDRSIDTPPDDYYRKGRYAANAEYETAANFLQSMTPRQELASFLAARASVWEDKNNLQEAVDTWCWAWAADPADAVILNTLKTRFNDWQRQVHARMPPRFPAIYHRCERRVYPPAFPTEMERDVQCVRAIQNLLDTQELDLMWWARMRRGEPVAGAPVEVQLRTAPDKFEISFRCAPAI